MGARDPEQTLEIRSQTDDLKGMQGNLFLRMLFGTSSVLHATEEKHSLIDGGELTIWRMFFDNLHYSCNARHLAIGVVEEGLITLRH